MPSVSSLFMGNIDGAICHGRWQTSLPSLPQSFKQSVLKQHVIEHHLHDHEAHAPMSKFKALQAFTKL